jgi:hypothetical protein
MALSEPFDLLVDFPGWVTSFESMRRQEQSRQANGRTIVKDLGPPLWHLVAQSKVLRPNALDYWRARLDALENGLATFKGYSLSRTYPILYPNGSWPTGVSFDGVSANLNTIDANRKAIRVGGLPVGFVFSVGDMLAIGTDLHRVMETATAAGGGLTGLFEVRPHLWPDVAVGSPPPVVSVYRPSCIMAIVPGSISTSAGINGWGSVTFEAMEARE